MTTIIDYPGPAGTAEASARRRQARRVIGCMADGAWRTLAEISAATGDPEASVSARLRDMRKAGWRIEVRMAQPGRQTRIYRATWFAP
jgi:predicted transcriptional regulator